MSSAVDLLRSLVSDAASPASTEATPSGDPNRVLAFDEAAIESESARQGSFATALAAPSLPKDQAKATSFTQFFTFKLNFMSEMGETKESWELLAGMIHQMWTDFHKVRAEAALVNYEADEDEQTMWRLLVEHDAVASDSGYLEKDFNHAVSSEIHSLKR
ncbi:hypothetical protein MPSEU_000753000 [Mayamaea pseudoterrestris]|nr:hypothetical protein MPSEU_000753000 [Mayamaea pseudoterrestris]